MKPFIELKSGLPFRFDDITGTIGNLRTHDIAHALSNICRYNGHCRRFYSVAQHSVYVSNLVPPEFAYEALLHDAHEALVGDMPTPLKAVVPGYKQLERKVEVAFRLFNGLPCETSDEVKRADLVMLATEKRDLMKGGQPWEILEGVEPTERFHVTPVDPREAAELFLDRWLEVV